MSVSGCAAFAVDDAADGNERVADHAADRRFDRAVLQVQLRVFERAPLGFELALCGLNLRLRGELRLVDCRLVGADVGLARRVSAVVAVSRSCLAAASCSTSGFRRS